MTNQTKNLQQKIFKNLKFNKQKKFLDSLVRRLFSGREQTNIRASEIQVSQFTVSAFWDSYFISWLHLLLLLGARSQFF